MTLDYWKAEFPKFVIDIARFDSPDEPGSGLIRMNENFMQKLQAARYLAGIPFIVTSGYRSPAHDKAVTEAAGKPTIPPEKNAHVLGYAADIACSDYISRYKIIKAAMAADIRRIFYDSVHVHLDDCPILPPYLLGPE